MTAREIARKIVDDIVADLTDRRGLKHEWARIDANIRQTILIKWIDIATDWIEQGTE